MVKGYGSQQVTTAPILTCIVAGPWDIGFVLGVVGLVLLLAGLLVAAVGVVIERRAGRWSIPTPAFVLLSAAFLLGVAGIVLALVSAALE